MISACGDKLEIRLNTDYRDVLKDLTFGHLIYTGPIDSFYENRFGELPYRSLRFENESFTPEQLTSREAISGKPGFWQPAMQVNFPNDGDFTRIVEIKHATGQSCPNTTIVREYPDDYGPDKEPYYPIPAPDAAALYQKYKALADSANSRTTSMPTTPQPRSHSSAALQPIATTTWTRSWAWPSQNSNGFRNEPDQTRSDGSAA
jgi:UDP-galactopyranose mutase